MAEIINMPKLGFDMAEGTLVRWVILEGEEVAKGAVLAEIETDKATVEVESSHAGVVVKHLVLEGEIVPVSTPIAVVADPGEDVDLEALLGERPSDVDTTKEVAPKEAERLAPESRPTEPAEEGVSLPGGVRASPLARRMAADAGIDLGKVQGSGPRGRIMKADIEAYQASPPPTEAPIPEPAKPARVPIIPLAPLPSTPAAQDEIVPLNRLRAAIGRRMTEAKQKLPHFYVTHKYDVGALLALRGQVNALLPPEQKISVNDFIVKGVALTLRQFPNLNASLRGDEIVRHGAVDIGVAVAVEGGLLTVVCHDTDRKPLRQIAQEIRLMAGRAREGKVRPEDIEGSTFSVSNLGMFDVEEFIAIINPPEAAILAVGSAREVPVVVDGEIVPGWRMKATISVDHRVSDGAEAAKFLQALAEYLEAPLRLLV